MILKNYWAHSGYDSEECFFAKVNRELIDRIKAEQEKTQKPIQEEATLAEVIPFPQATDRDQRKKAA